MRWNSIRAYILTALGVLGLCISALLSASETESWPVVEESLGEAGQQLEGLKAKLSELRSEKTHLFNENYGMSNEDRGVAKEPKLQNQRQEAQLEELNAQIRLTENKIDRSVKKREYLNTVKTELRDPDVLDQQLTDLDKSLAGLQKDLKPIHSRMEQLAKTCKECKAALISLDREPAGEREELREFRTLLRKRNQLEGSIDSFALRVEALEDVKAYHNGREATLHPHRLTGPRPLDIGR